MNVEDPWTVTVFRMKRSRPAADEDGLKRFQSMEQSGKPHRDCANSPLFRALILAAAQY